MSLISPKTTRAGSRGQATQRNKMLSFSRNNRLVGRSDFRSLFAKPNKTTHKYLLALHLPNHRPQARLGIVISKHYVKHAVDRNLLRRIIRESFRHHKEILKGLDLVVLMRSKWSPLDNKVRRVDVDNLWRKLIQF